MFDCKNLLHPFQNDPGTSQRQRIIDQLLSDSVKIDGRSLADLLNYFSKLARGINYYDKNLNVSDWQPFFNKSLPFLLASLSKYDDYTTNEKFKFYKSLFEKNSSIPGLQLIIYFIYYNTFIKIYNWYGEINGSQLPIETGLEELIRTKLVVILKKFIGLSNAASKWFCVKKIDFTKFLDTAENDVWNLQLAELYKVDESFRKAAVGKCAQLKALYESISDLFPSLLEAMKLLNEYAEKSINQSLIPLRNELKENHPPHLALVFAFIRLFQELQGELNKKTREHLHFFYTEVLKIKPEEAKSDKVHILFELQKLLQGQFEKYRITKDTKLNGGRDDKNADIIFETDDEIIVNETQVAEVRTLFLNNQEVYEQTYLEGVYIAPQANKADGVEKDFKEDPKNWYTLGRDISKYIEPGKKTPKLHPSARLGFVLASPVLYLAEGTREITISLDCQLSDSLCSELQGLCIAAGGDNCPDYPEFYEAKKFYTSNVRDFLIDTVTNKPKSYISISAQLLDEAKTQGMDKRSAEEIRAKYLEINGIANLCTGDPVYRDSVLIESTDWTTYLNIAANATINSEVNKLPDLFKKKYPLNLYFSGEKEWIEPSSITTLNLTPLGINDEFTIRFVVLLKADKPAVTFYNKDNLKENLGTEQPVVRIEIDDSLKIRDIFKGSVPACSLEKIIKDGEHYVSLYHFFRNVIVKENTTIKVKVCGLKNFIVQNDENVMDVNGPIYPFGTRPSIIDFDIVNPSIPPLLNPNLIGPNFYIGSKEVFCKKWEGVRININWNNKPTSFREYYKAYVVEDIALQIFGLDQNRFKIMISALHNKKWDEEAAIKNLFDTTPSVPFPAGLSPCDENFDQSILLKAIDFPGQVAQDFFIDKQDFKEFGVNTKNGFIKLNLRNQDFLHKDYSFVLARQMMALGRYPDALIEGAVYKKDGNTVIVFRSLGKTIVDLKDDIIDTKNFIENAKNKIDALNTIFDAAIDFPPPLSPITNAERNILIPLVHDSKTLSDTALQQASDTKDQLADFQNILDIFNILTGEIVKPLTVLIPNEPWTPIISNISLDYTATAKIEDIDLIHLYPYKGTYKAEEIELAPTLFPTFCDEGTLFIGLTALQPGSNLNILFQLAEATADSESEKEKVRWHYLDNNIWKDLRTGFEVLDDATLNLTTSGIIKFSLPENMTKENTVMPKNIYWIKASLGKNSRSVSEIIGIHTQAISATFTIDVLNDTSRLDKPLEAGSIEKLLVADPAIKTVGQPYESFGGRLPELEGSYYLRVSELLRHKGRAIQKWDYERLTLEEFPLIFKAKCINHSFHTNAHTYENDVPYAPGFVILAVIPDLRKLKAGNSFEPKVPVSMLENIEIFLKKISSPFVRLRASNPRYERIHFCLTIRLMHGRDENYYKEKLKQDLREFLAPWAVGKYDKLTFGQCVFRSDIIRFLERTGYVDFVSELRMTLENNPMDLTEKQKVCPVSPRSILIAGEIDIKIDEEVCDSWCARAPASVLCDDTELVQDYCIEKKNDPGQIN